MELYTAALGVRQIQGSGQRGGNFRSLGRIQKCSQRTFNSGISGAKLKNAQHFLICIHLPLLLLNETTLVFGIIPPPELQLLLGAFYHLSKYQLMRGI
jgi:hypothetical protein